MIKYIILAVILNGLIFASKFLGSDVKIEIIAPDFAEAGTTVQVEVVIHKSRIHGFARFQQELPYGITASPVYPADMSFSFDNNTVKMIWLNLPEEEMIRIRYNIHINERLKGTLNLNGTFSYILDNSPRSAEAHGKNLAVNPSPHIDEALIVDINQAEQQLLSPIPVSYPAAGIIAARQNPVPDNDIGYVVNIMIEKAELDHFAKIDEIIPEGFRAIEIDSKGGIFSFKEGNVKIIWSKMPPENNFIVSYRLIPEDEFTGTPPVTGEFTYMYNNVTSGKTILPVNTDIRSLSERERQEFTAALLHETVLAESPAPLPAESRTTFEDIVTEDKTVKDPVPVRPQPVRPQQVRPQPVSPQQVSPQQVPRSADIDYLLQPEPGVYYRVQLAAGYSPVDIKSYFSARNVNEEVRFEMHEGWIKYSVGSYHDYRSARESRVYIWNTTPIDDAFVAAYNEGIRISVQEALMIANHQWYR